MLGTCLLHLGLLETIPPLRNTAHTLTSQPKMLKAQFGNAECAIELQYRLTFDCTRVVFAQG